MQITRDVVNDLLPMYLAGEASADTKALVEEFCVSDGEFARLVESTRSTEISKQPVSFKADQEKQTLKRLKRLIKMQTWFLAGAILFTLVPLSIRIENGSISFLILGSTTWLAAVYWLIAAGFWLGYVLTRRQLSVSGM